MEMSIHNRDEFSNPDFFNDLKNVIQSGDYVSGPQTRMCEEKLKTFLNVPHVVLTASCTSALQIALMAFGIKAGDKVIVPAFSSAATLNAVTSIGAVPVFVDPVANGSGLDPDALKRELKYESAIKAILFAHLFGHPAETYPIYQLAKEYGCWVVEDRAQWFTSRQPTSCPDHVLHCYSFGPGHPIYTLGSCGAITGTNATWIEACLALRDQGRSLETQRHILGRGLNAKPSEMNALYLNYKLHEFETIHSKRMDVIEQYKQWAREMDIAYIQPTLEETYSTWSKFVILVDFRDQLQSYLQSKGFESAVHYPYTLDQLASGGMGLKVFPNARELSKRALTLPVHANLGADYFERLKNAIVAYRTQNS